MVNPTGYTALDLVGFTDKGDYNSSATYVQSDLVHSGGSIWRCLIDDTTGVAPSGESLNWAVFVAEPTNMAFSMIAPVETSPAEHAYAIGDQLIFNDILYVATANITIGDDLTPGTNIALADTVTDQIADNKADIAKKEVLVITASSVSSLPQTINNAAIETDMVCIKAECSNSAAYLDATVNTDTAGQAVISGTISGTTNITLYLMKSR
jgi:hypothetical protein